MHLIPLNCSLETGQDGKFYGYLITIKKKLERKKRTRSESFEGEKRKSVCIKIVLLDLLRSFRLGR